MFYLRHYGGEKKIKTRQIFTCNKNTCHVTYNSTCYNMRGRHEWPVSLIEYHSIETKNICYSLQSYLNSKNLIVHSMFFILAKKNTFIRSVQYNFCSVNNTTLSKTVIVRDDVRKLLHLEHLWLIWNIILTFNFKKVYIAQ